MITPLQSDSFIVDRTHSLLLHSTTPRVLNLCWLSTGDYYLFLKSIGHDGYGKPVHEWTTDPNEAHGFDKMMDMYAAAKLLPKDWMLCVHYQVSEILGLVRDDDGKYCSGSGYVGLRGKIIERMNRIRES